MRSVPNASISMGEWGWANALSPDSSFALVTGQNEVALAAISPHEEPEVPQELQILDTTRVPVEGWVWCAAISHDGSFAIFASDDDSSLRIAEISYDAEGAVSGMHVSAKGTLSVPATVYSCAISEDDSFVVFGTGGKDKRIRTARVRKTASGYVLEEHEGGSLQADGEVYVCVIGDTQKMLAYGTSAYKVHGAQFVCDENGTTVGVEACPNAMIELDGQPYCMEFSRKHSMLLVGTESEALELFDVVVDEKTQKVKEFTRREDLRIPFETPPTAVHFSSDHQMMLIGAADGNLALFNAEYDEHTSLLKRLSPIPGPSYSLGVRVVDGYISKSGTFAIVSTANDATTHIIDLTAPTPAPSKEEETLKHGVQTLESGVTEATTAPTLKQYNKEQESLVALEEVSQLLGLEADVIGILTEIATKIGKAVGAKWVNFWELTEDKKGLYVSAAYGMDEAFMEQTKVSPIPVGSAFIGRAVETGRPWGAANCRTSPKTFSPLMKGVVRLNVYGLLCIPMRSQGEIVGGTCIYYQHPHPFSQFELRLTTIAANQAATAVRNIRTYKELQAERNKTTSIIYSLNDGLILYDTEGKITLFNPRAQELLLLDEKIVRDVPVKDIDAPESVAVKNLKNISHLVTEDYKTQEYETVGHQKLTLQITQIFVSNPEGEKIGTMHVLHDVTKEKEVEKLKANFVSVASHQLRTPLTGMKWSLEALTTQTEDLFDEQQKKTLQDLSHINSTLIRLVNDLLDVSRIEEGRFGFVFSTQDIKPLTEQVIDNLEVNARQRNITVVCGIAPDTPALCVDPDKFVLVLQNLLDNAIKYTPEGGRVEVLTQKTDSTLSLLVKDTGIGIPKADQPFIFTKFFRAENAIKFHTDGSGLGLYIVKSTIEKHNASVRFESKENNGTTFFIDFPLDPNDMPRGQKEEPPEDPKERGAVI